jgi:hypothetical protein
VTSDADGMGRIKGEIQFFMEKCFQASFGYLAVLGVVLAASKTSYVSSLANSLDVEARVVIAAAVLSLNLFYFTMILACTFGIVKRGLFIFENTNEPVDRTWEKFSRMAPDSEDPKDDEHEHEERTKQSGRRKQAEDETGARLPRSLMHSVVWNIDNYFMFPIFFLLFILSMVAAVVGASASRGWALVVILLLVAFYSIPCVIAFYLRVLDTAVKHKIATTQKDTATGEAATTSQ